MDTSKINQSIINLGQENGRYTRLKGLFHRIVGLAVNCPLPVCRDSGPSWEENLLLIIACKCQPKWINLSK